MKILMIAPQPFFEPRGTPISVYQRAEMLAELGHQVDLLTYHLGTDVSISGVRIHRIVNVPWIQQVPIGPSYAKLALDVLLFLEAARMLTRNQYDVIHSHEEAAFFCPLLSFVFATRHLYDMHSNLPRQLRNSKFGKWWPIVKTFELLERWAIKTSDVVITIGSDLQKRVSQINAGATQFLIENLPIERDSPFPHCLTVGELRESLRLNGSSPIVYTGSFESYQGIGLLLDAASIIKEQDEDITFVMVGGTPEQVAYWRENAKRKELDDRFRFVGTVPTSDVFAYLELADVLVSPRESGTSVPLKIYAYLQAGKPTVATNVDAHTEVLNEETTLLVDATAEAFAEGVLKLVRSPNLMRRLGTRAKELAASRYSPSKQLAKLERAYRAIIAVDNVAKQASSTN